MSDTHILTSIVNLLWQRSLFFRFTKILRVNSKEKYECLKKYLLIIKSNITISFIPH